MGKSNFSSESRSKRARKQIKRNEKEAIKEEKRALRQLQIKLLQQLTEVK